MNLAHSIVEMRYEASQIELFERALIGAKAYSSVNKWVMRCWSRIREVVEELEWVIEEDSA